MKTAQIPAIRIEPRLREDLEAVLAEGESLSSFVESTVREAVEHRRMQADFRARGQASWEEFIRAGESYSSAEVIGKLRAMTAARRAELHERSDV